MGDLRIAVHRQPFVDLYVCDHLNILTGVAEGQGSNNLRKGLIEEHWYGVQLQLARFQLSEVENICLLYTSPSPRDGLLSRMPSSA